MLTAERLRESIHSALSLWHRSHADGAPLADLVLYQRALAQMDSVRGATNQLLNDAIDQLAEQSDEEAAILRLRFIEERSAQMVAQRLSMSEGNVFKKQREAIDHLADIVLANEQSLRAGYQDRFTQHLPAATYTALFGIEQSQGEIVDLLVSVDAPWLISVEGIGGIGKTSLAHALLCRLIEEGVVGWRVYTAMAWVTARRQQINAGGALHDLSRPALQAEELTIALAEQLLPADERRDLPVSVLETRVRRLLKQSPHLIVIDNLETDADILALRDLLQGWANPSKFLLTSRRSLFDQLGVYPHRLPELTAADSLALVRHEARVRNLPQLAAADDVQLQPIYQTAGGNPLALRLVVGLTHVHSLEHVLADLVAAKGQAVEQLYTHIYRRSWAALDEDARRLLLVMPLINENGADLDLIAAIAGQPVAQLRPILERLVSLNLVESRGDLHQRCFTIHSLTRAFLHEQVLRWSPESRYGQHGNA